MLDAIDSSSLSLVILKRNTPQLAARVRRRRFTVSDITFHQ